MLHRHKRQAGANGDAENENNVTEENTENGTVTVDETGVVEDTEVNEATKTRIMNPVVSNSTEAVSGKRLVILNIGAR